MILITVIFVVAFAGLVILTWAILAGAGKRKAQKLKVAFPNSLVLQANSGSALSRVLELWPDSPALPLSFSIVADESGVTFWSDVHHKIYSIDWRFLRSAVVVEVPERGRSTRGIELVIRSKGQDIPLPVIVLGAGPFGALPLSAGSLQAACSSMERWRTEVPQKK